MSSGEKYVAAAYGVFVVVVLVWVAILAAKLSRLERETGELARLARRVPQRATRPMAELLVWPALIAYGEAAFAYAGELRGHGRYGRLGIWGVRIGWLAQTALLVVQALSARRVPVGNLGRRAQLPLLARRLRLPHLGLQAAVPAVGLARDAGRGRAPRAGVGRRRHRRRPGGRGRLGARRARRR